jgi:hypothetical protein
MQTKPTIRDAWNYLRDTNMIGRVPVAEQLEKMRLDPLEQRRAWYAQQLASVIIHHSKVRG